MAAVHHLAFLEFQNFNSKSTVQRDSVVVFYRVGSAMVFFVVFSLFFLCSGGLVFRGLFCRHFCVASYSVSLSVVPHASCVSVFGCRPRSVLSTRFAWDSTAPTALRSGACRPSTAASRCPRCRYAPSSRWRSNRKTRWLPPPPATTRPCRLPSTTTLPEFDLRNGCRRP